MGKKVKKQKKKLFDWHVALLIVLLLLLAAEVWLATLFSRTEIPELTFDPSVLQESQSTESGPSQQESGPAESDSSQQKDQPATDTEEPQVSSAMETFSADGLRITGIRGYTGIYMEDGSDEIVSNVMMILLENTSEQDLQLARIDIQYADFTAEFEVTNLPAGESAVLLEKNRLNMPEDDCISIEARNIAFFQTPMSLMEDTFEITGGNGYLDVKNISDSATGGKVYVYYKHASSDLLYGGITFRATVNEPIAPGETIRILTNHYTADNSRILAVVCSN